MKLRFNSIKENFPHAPEKISLFSRYERVTDRRTFKDRRDLWAVPKEKPEFVAEKPKAKLRTAIEPRKKKNADDEEAHEEEEKHEENEE